MKRFIRDQLLDIIGTILDAVQQLKRTDENVAAILIADCSDAFVAVGGALAEELSNERYLEYEKLINSILEQIGNIMSQREQKKSISEPSSQLKNLIITLKSELEHESEVKREIVFLPYNASMWDSFESIWEAARRDPECECFVIPIPYYDRNPDRSLVNRHYEFDKFPEYVPVLDYREYDFELHRPDVIYIHNPYDGGNLITSVEPFFYSNQLVNYTDMLVYIPYFIATETMPEHFTQLPGVHYSHRTIVQSEEIAKKYHKLHNPEKILALGSPKTDTVIKLSKNPPEPPEEWKEIMRGRKAVMYNTTLAGLWQYNEKYIEKIRYIFSLFEQRQDDLVLIWRPHPLSEESAKSMRPRLLKAYNALVDEYKEKKFGIYDDTPDFHTAMSISAGYIGGGSSLDLLFGVTGKPVMLQCGDITRSLTEDEMGVFWFRDIAVDGDEAWFSAQNHNGLYKMNLTTGKTELIAHIPFCRENGCNLFLAIEKLGGKLFLAPFLADCILEYEISTGEFKRIEPEFTGFPYMYINIIRHEEKLFFIPCTNNDIIEYNAKTGQYTHHTRWYNQVKDMLAGTNGYIFGFCNAVIGEYIYMPFQQSNCIVRFDMRSGDAKLIYVGAEDNKYGSTSSDGHDIWITDISKAEITRYDPESNRTYVYSDFSCVEELPVSPFHRTASYEDAMLIFPNQFDSILRLDKNSGKASKFTDIPLVNNKELCYFPYRNSQCLCVNDTGSNTYVLQTYGGPLYRLDKTSGEVSKIEIEYSKAQAAAASSLTVPDIVPDTAQIYSEYLFNEANLFNGAEQYLDYIASTGTVPNTNQINSLSTLFANLDGTVGERIHTYIMGQLK